MPTPKFQAIVDEFYEPLYRFGFSLSGNRDDASDLAQQTFFIWARHGTSLRDVSKAKSWLFTTLYREYLKLHRHARRMTAVDEPELCAIPEDDSSTWIKRLDVPAVVSALRAVDDLFRVPVTLFYLEDLSYKEIAAVLEVPIGTVMSRLARGKQQLRLILNRTGNVNETDSNRVVSWPGNPDSASNHG